MIDHLVEEYGVDPNGTSEENGCTALHEAAWDGRVRTVKHLVEKHNVDIHERTENYKDNDETIDGATALGLAEMCGMTACADYLRSLMSTRPPPS